MELTRNNDKNAYGMVLTDIAELIDCLNNLCNCYNKLTEKYGKELERITGLISNQIGSIEPMLMPESEASVSLNETDSYLDPYFDQAAQIIVATQTASRSALQRQFSIGYNHAGHLMDQLEKAGIVGPALESQKRKVLVDSNGLEALLKELHS